MPTERMNIFGCIAFILTCTAASLLTAGCIIPDWRITNQETERLTEKEGMLSKTTCINSICRTVYVLGKIDGGEEWFFICKVFALFAMCLCNMAALLQLFYFCFTKRMVRTPSMYMVGCAGVFILMCVFIFIAMYQTAQQQNIYTDVEIKLGYPVGLCMVAGVFAIAAAIMTAVSAIRAEKDVKNRDRKSVV